MADGMMNNSTSTQSLDEMLGNWREEIKGKQRGLFSFEDIVDMKLKDLKTKIYKMMIPADSWMMRQAYYKKVGEYEYIDDEWKSIKIGQTWGGNDVSCFFKQKITIPESMQGEKVALMVYFGGDSLVSINGVPYQGMDPFRNIVLLTESAKVGEEYEIYVESYYMWHHGESEIKKLECSYIVALDDEIEKIYWDYKAAYNGLAITNISKELKNYLHSVIKEAIRYIRDDLENKDQMLEYLRIGDKILQEKIYNCDKFKLHGKIDLVGHSHLDVVFLWTYDEFIRKLGRTHATMLRLIEQYPKFIFTQSQPAMYKEMKKYYPTLFEQVKQRIKEGRWEAIGGMWVEPDCNLISGESMTRQILFGKRFYEKEFGINTRTCWLPDVFGNCYTMPQILKKSGIDFFVTHKMGVWNDTNPWKYHTFLWEGPDGSRVFASQPPTHFIGTMEPDHLSLNWNRFSDKQEVGESIFCYGWGDGGGGVDSEMLEYVDRYSHFPGLPETEPVKAEDALERMSRNAKNLPVWKNELYLEAHRGVYTTKGLLKKFNRYCENLYRDAEIYSVIASFLGCNYPQLKINEGWEKLLTNQFHDSLPGSHINKVYYDLLNEYKTITKIGECVRNNSIEFINNNISVLEIENFKPYIVYNSLHFESSRLTSIDVVSDDCFIVKDEKGEIVEHQVVKDIEENKKLVFLAENVPAIGYKVFYIGKSDTFSQFSRKFELSSKKIENDFYLMKFNKNGEIDSLYDKQNGRDVLVEGGRGNVFKLYKDMPSRYEAWDIVETYLDNEFEIEPGSIEICDNGPVFCSVLLNRKFLNSTLKQKIILYNKLPRIDFETKIDWVERRKLLKVGFEIDLISSDYTSDIAYGNIKRSSYRSNSFDKAKFEVSAHNWIDMSEQGYGVSILNDCKYGFDVKEKKMSITLLKGAMNPDPESDIGVHYFKYSLLPHKGTWKEAGTNEKGLEFNNPLVIVAYKGKNGNLPSKYSFMKIKDRNLSFEAMKKAEDDDSIIIRIVERYGKRTKSKISLFKNIKKASECDLQEKELEVIKLSDGELEFEIKPYEIKTFKIEV